MSARCARSARGDALGREAVADAEMGVDVDPAGRGALELAARLAYEDVHRAVAIGHLAAPHQRVDLGPRDHPVGRLASTRKVWNSRTVRPTGRPSASSWYSAGR